MTAQDITIIISIMALGFSIFSNIRASNKQDKKAAEEAGRHDSAIITKLELIQSSLLEVKQDIKSHKEEMERITERTIRSEESLKSLHKRVDRMERLLQSPQDSRQHETE